MLTNLFESKNINMTKIRELLNTIKLEGVTENKRFQLVKYIKKQGLKIPQCIKDSIMNCKSYFQGKCVTCQNEYFMKNYKCFEIDEKNKVMNCEIYYSDQKCTTCKRGFIMYNNLCFRMNMIHNCEVKAYDPKGQCLLCKSGYFYNHN